MARETRQALESANSPAKGRADAPVSVVLFSDFECPYCKSIYDFVAGLRPEELGQIRLIFKQRPLAMHKWARRAAAASICVSLQSNDLFWRFHDFLFSRQPTITADTFDTVVEDFAATNPEFDQDRYHQCIVGPLAESELARDEALASTYHVDLSRQSRNVVSLAK